MIAHQEITVLADGCFDPLHEGHVAYLYAARALGTKLIVNAASDDEIWRKRPSIGPFLPQSSRVALIRALKPVSDVVVSETSESLRVIRPDIYVKGRDWEGRIPHREQKICQSLGIQIRFVDTLMNTSTGLIQRFLSQVRIGQKDSA